MHSVGSIPHNAEIDVPLVYADYYFLEALQRYDVLLKKGKLF
jgi:chondroitin AC lyase